MRKISLFFKENFKKKNSSHSPQSTRCGLWTQLWFLWQTAPISSEIKLPWFLCYAFFLWFVNFRGTAYNVPLQTDRKSSILLKEKHTSKSKQQGDRISRYDQIHEVLELRYDIHFIKQKFSVQFTLGLGCRNENGKYIHRWIADIILE